MLIANRYEATGNAAWGGMSEVHECIDKHLDRKVVLKRVKRTADTSRLIDEQKALLALRAKHVVELLDIVEYDYLGRQETALILEYIRGDDLSEGSAKCGKKYLKMLWQIAAGLCDIHAAGVIHRDIKPNNIRRDEMGVMKIFDFGLSRREGVDNQTRSQAGTDGYMAPELFGSETIGFSSAIDVYAFGETALSLLTPQSAQFGKAKARCDVVLAEAEPEVRECILACLAKDPADRPPIASVKDVLDRLLLHNKHRGAFHNGNQIFELNKNKRSIALRTTAGTLSLSYDGYRFIVDSVSGNVSINNRPLSSGDEISKSGVIIFRPDGQGVPAFLPYDCSNPRVDI